MSYNRIKSKDLNVFQFRQQPHSESVYVFMSVIFPEIKETDVEVIHTDLTEDNVFGWTLINNDQNEIEIHNDPVSYTHLTLPTNDQV